jgi:hypothetical protein
MEDVMCFCGGESTVLKHCVVCLVSLMGVGMSFQVVHTLSEVIHAIRLISPQMWKNSAGKRMAKKKNTIK